eukprot:CAMPEP_0170604060 /NCGR_PEP_ID=MMETSP0224-20130122/19228_1 /TAXON_ID=285029 /ORGANISM="Togula jolla, Strain CCCM 725" /LENGTH=140 /DNA_ID=CAMNT_0010928951 /DNA_START=192 /DNA_END=615 /DNA_ORIENTATION=-
MVAPAAFATSTLSAAIAGSNEGSSTVLCAAREWPAKPFPEPTGATFSTSHDRAAQAAEAADGRPLRRGAPTPTGLAADGSRGKRGDSSSRSSKRTVRRMRGDEFVGLLPPLRSVVATDATSLAEPGTPPGKSSQPSWRGV